MTTGCWVLVGIAAVFAVLDWLAVASESRRVEVVAKPTTLGLLVAAAILARPERMGVHLWLVVALIFGLIGDLALVARSPAEHGILHREAPDWFFVIGLVSFLLGHLSYCAAILRYGVELTSVLFGLALVVLMLFICTSRIVGGAYRQGGPMLASAITLYIVTLSTAVTLAVGTSSLLIAYGSLLFAASDLILAYDRFAKAQPWSRVAVVVSYHVAQFFLLIGLLR
jgi:uncharacterized membrane protein YhhN